MYIYINLYVYIHICTQICIYIYRRRGKIGKWAPNSNIMTWQETARKHVLLAIDAGGPMPETDQPGDDSYNPSIYSESRDLVYKLDSSHCWHRITSFGVQSFLWHGSVPDSWHMGTLKPWKWDGRCQNWQILARKPLFSERKPLLINQPVVIWHSP